MQTFSFLKFLCTIETMILRIGLFFFLLISGIYSQESYVIAGYKWAEVDSTLDSVITNQDWKKIQTDRLNMGFSQKAIWLKVPPSHQEFLEIDRSTLDYVTYYYLEDGIWKQMDVGDSVVSSKRFISSLTLVFPAQRQETYIKIISSSGISAPIRFFSKEDLFEKLQMDTGRYFIILGIILGLWFYNLFLYFGTRISLYLDYVLYSLGSLLLSITATGVGSIYIWPNLPDVNNIVHIGAILFMAIFGIRFLVNFLSLEGKSKLRDIFHLSMQIFPIFIFVLSFYKYQFAFRISTLNGSVVIIYSLVVSMISYFQGNKVARFFIFAFLQFLILMLINILSISGVLPFTVLAKDGPYVGMALEMSIFSLALADRINQMRKEKEKAEKEKIESKISLLESFAKFFPKEFISNLNKESLLDIRKGEFQKKVLTILFLDIRKFTNLTEELGSEKTFLLLQQILETICPIIYQNQGFIDKFIGDSVLALFPENSDLAIQSAFEMNQAMKEKFPNIQTGIGIHKGEIVLGTLGVEDRMETTVIGDPVNTASRIESKTKELGYPILVSEDCLQETSKEKFSLLPLGEIQLRGKKEGISIWGHAGN